MQVSLLLLSISEDLDNPGTYHSVYLIETPDEARALATRIGRSLILELPDAQPPDIYSVSIPEEEAQVNEPKGKRRR
jgi:hypothetical protein